MATSNILQFAPTDTGSNLLSDAAYLAASDRTNGNQPGVASSRLNNKALRQSSAVAAGVAQFIANRQGTNITDALTTTQIETAMAAATSGRLLRTLIFIRIAGVQNVIIDGAAATTTGAGTYTPNAAMTFAEVEVLGGGGGGAGAGGAGAGNVSIGGGGTSGSYGKARFTAASIGASQTITVGNGGAGGNNAVGSPGGTSSFGSLLTGPGGTGGPLWNNILPPTNNGNGVAPSAPTGANLISITGVAGMGGFASGTGTGAMFAAAGGSSIFGAGPNGPAGNVNGSSAIIYGTGGTGAAVNQGGGTASGGTGAAGIVIVREYA